MFVLNLLMMILFEANLSAQSIQSNEIKFQLENEGRVSLGIFNTKGVLVRTLLIAENFPKGRHSIHWDGKDQRSQFLPKGSYRWRLLQTDGFQARYLTTLGINPPQGEHPVPKKSWVGDHLGVGLVDVDSAGVYIGSPITEGLLMSLGAEPDLKSIRWRRPQFYQGGRLQKIVGSGSKTFMLHPKGRLRQLNSQNGHVEREWQVQLDGEQPQDFDARGENLVLTYTKKNLVCWLSVESGKEVKRVEFQQPAKVCAFEDSEGGAIIFSSGQGIYKFQGKGKVKKVGSFKGSLTALDYDLKQKELWGLLDGHRVVVWNSEFKIVRKYGDRPRPLGRYQPTLFRQAMDLASDLKGGFYIAEPSFAPRRLAHFSKDGKLIDEWYGGMSFYVDRAVDPDNPNRIYGITGEGFVTVYDVNFDTGEWSIEECYLPGRLGDSLYPFASSYKAVRKNGELFLYHRVVPGVIKLDPKTGKTIPVAIAGRVLNRGRTFFQFAGSGQDGYPRPWVQAAIHHGYKDLKKAPKLYSWADTDSDGEFDPEEFRFYPDQKESISFHNPGDFTADGDYIASGKINRVQICLRLPVKRWEGKNKVAPRWDWDQLEGVGEAFADNRGYGSPRGLSVGPDGSIAVAYQAGLMIRDHGQYEGGGWPEAALKGSRVLKFDSKFNPRFASGRQSKRSREANSGVLYYPMQTTFGPNNSVVVNDQTKQAAQVWSHDGLYVGGFLDNRAQDGLDNRFYQVHGDDNQGATVITAKNGKTYWLQPYQGHNRVFEISGWKNWQRQTGELKIKTTPSAPSIKGTGLKGTYTREEKSILTVVEDPIYYERFGGERHSKKISAPYKVTWKGTLVPTLTDRYKFRTFLGKKETVSLWIEGQLIYSNGGKQAVDRTIDLKSDKKYKIKIEYDNPDGRSELKLLWSSRVIDPGRIPKEVLFH